MLLFFDLWVPIHRSPSSFCLGLIRRMIPWLSFINLITNLLWFSEGFKPSSLVGFDPYMISNGDLLVVWFYYLLNADSVLGRAMSHCHGLVFTKHLTMLSKPLFAHLFVCGKQWLMSNCFHKVCKSGWWTCGNRLGLMLLGAPWSLTISLKHNLATYDASYDLH